METRFHEDMDLLRFTVFVKDEDGQVFKSKALCSKRCLEPVKDYKHAAVRATEEEVEEMNNRLDRLLSHELEIEAQ